MDLINERFQGFRSLIGDEAYVRIQNSSVCVIGLGGVGSWAVEALARSGVGAITLVDLDEVCVTNINRQLHALTGTVGESKAEVLAERVRQINPACRVVAVKKFFSSSTADEILARPFTMVLDAIDSVENKTTLIGSCVERDQMVLTVGSGGNRLNPLGVQVVDLAATIHDPLLQIIRKRLRQDHDFPRGERAKFGVPCVYAPLQRGPRDTTASCSADGADTPKKTRKTCNDGLGSAVFVTGSLGFAAAAETIQFLAKSEDERGLPFAWKKKRAERLSLTHA